MGTSPTMKKVFAVYAAAMVIFFHLPIASVFLASLSKSRFFSFPIKKYSLEWYETAFTTITPQQLLRTSLLIASAVTVFSVVLGYAGAMAFARYHWRGRKVFQRVLVLPVFFPQAVLGLSLLLWFKNMGLQASWQTAVFAHLVWIVPIVTLIVSIRVYGLDPDLEQAARDLGASRWKVLREITLPLLWPGIRTGAVFAFILSWINFPLSLFTSGSDSTVPVWIYAKMVGGYTPLVPTMGGLSIMGAVLLAGLSFLIIWGLGRRKHRRIAEQAAEA